jgi:CBS domain-containing protein
MREKNVSGIFVVSDNDKLVSIFTERDIVRSVFENISLEGAVKNVMVKDVITFTPSMQISAAISIASREKKRHLPVVEEDRIVGMITYRDLVSYLLPEISYMMETA